MIGVRRKNVAEGRQESPPTWLKIGEQIALGEERSCRVVDVTVKKVRLDFVVPPDVVLLRKEIYELVKRESPLTLRLGGTPRTR